MCALETLSPFETRFFISPSPLHEKRMEALSRSPCVEWLLVSYRPDAQKSLESFSIYCGPTECQE